MKAARPLLFLTYRTIVNGLRRALTTPRRLISLVLFLGYYFLIFIRPAFTSKSDSSIALPSGVDQLDFPPLQIIDGVAFGLFALLSLFMLMGVMSANATFKPADVDVLFATPISPKLVLTFRIFRDYLITLLLPMLIAVFGLRPAKMGWEAIFKDMPNPEYSGMALRFITLGWLLMAMSWVTVSYAVSLWVNRTDAAGPTRKKVFGWSLTILCVALVGFLTWRFSRVQAMGDVIALLQMPLLRVVFFNASFATQMTLAPFTDAGPLSAMLGAGGLIGVIALGYWLSLRQVGWMYDLSAIRASAIRTSVEMQRSGDMAGLVAQRAREGKYKPPKLRFISRLSMPGWKALIWKELMLQPRTTLGLTVMFVLIGVFMSVIGVLPSERSRMSTGYFLLFMQSVTVFMIAMAIAQTGFIEVLKRVDLQKPMPFPSWVTVSAEIFSKALVAVLATWLGAIVAIAVKPALWAYGVASLVAVPGFAFMLTAAVFFTTMLFPDIEDPSQRSLRGILMLVCVVVCGAFPALATIGLLAVDAHPIIATAGGSVLAAGIGLLLSSISAKLYENFNPSD